MFLYEHSTPKMHDGFARRCFLCKQFLDVDITVCDLPGDPRGGRLRDTGAVTLYV